MLIAEHAIRVHVLRPFVRFLKLRFVVAYKTASVCADFVKVCPHPFKLLITQRVVLSVLGAFEGVFWVSFGVCFVCWGSKGHRVS